MSQQPSKKLLPTEYPNIRFSSDAIDDIKKLSTDLQRGLRRELVELSCNPDEHSKPAPTPPYLPGYNIFVRRVEGDDRSIHWFHVLHHLRSGEIKVEKIGHQTASDLK